ncbi:hypothetical protein ACFC26_01190 [Kitasatospora purpeofusca]|uniref:terpene synthase family protein n=1 Tax=Kitasatospora purpeofusca TaxID=67352 RepID=UPI0035DE1B35
MTGPGVGASDPVAALLAPYREVLAAPGAAALAAALLAEVVADCGCDRGASWHARQAVLSTVFELHASPADADFAEHLTVGRFITLFFLVDDGPPEKARALARAVLAVADARAGAGYGAGYGDSEPARQLRVLVDDCRGRGLPTDRLTALIAEFCAATAEESAGPPPPGHSRARRAETVGVRPHIECWRLLRGLPLPAPGSPDRPLPEATVELVYLVNDLLSAAVEERAGGSVAAGNTVLARARATGDRAGAVEAAVARHNALVAVLAAARHRPLGALLGELVDGNRTAHRALTGLRYPGLPLDVFDRLHTVGGAVRR